jgi:hypothetical protein
MNPVSGIALGRIAIGATALVSPTFAGGLFRLDVTSNAQRPYMTRMFGSRELALGVVTLLARGPAQRKLGALGIAVDAADAFAGITAAQSGAVSKTTGALLSAPAVAAVLAGVAGVRSA